MVKLTTLLSKCILSDCSQSEEYCYRFYALCILKIKLSLVRVLKEATIPCLFSCHKRTEMSAILDEEKHMVSQSRTGVQK